MLLSRFQHWALLRRHSTVHFSVFLGLSGAFLVSVGVVMRLWVLSGWFGGALWALSCFGVLPLWPPPGIRTSAGRNRTDDLVNASRAPDHCTNKAPA